MEELAAAFSGSFQVTKEPNSTVSPHPRFGMYKMKSEVSNQERRRNQILQLQKEKRYDAMKHVRCLTDDCWEDDEEFEGDEEETEQAEAMEVEVHWRRPGRHYRNQLMLSEWMLEVPESFAANWLMVPCPVGKRNLVITSRGVTRAYAKNGRVVNTFQSILPGGNRSGQQWKSDSTILDCVYDEVTRTYYVLDMMCWKKTPIYDSETEFRFYWLQTKLAEVTDDTSATSENLCRYRFVPLRNFSCEKETIQSLMNEPLHMNLDGLLFYHKQAHYTFGSTPLVVWLKAYMLPEILGVQVPDQYVAETPSTYGNFQQHSDAVRQKQADEEKRQSERSRQRELASENNGCDSHHATMDCQQMENLSVAQNGASLVDGSDAKPN